MSDNISRYILRTDERVTKLAGIPLPAAWWSRPQEYAWAQRFARRGTKALDAACGISHPFKLSLYLLDGVDTYALDSDPRLGSVDAIVANMVEDLGFDDTPDLREALAKIHCAVGSLEGLPYETETFDTVFCLSVLEHLPPGVRVRALSELARSLKREPEARLVLTFDVPDVDPREMVELLYTAGLKPAGPVDFEVPADALESDMWGRPLKVFRLVAKPIDCRPRQLLIASPIRQKPDVLALFLASLARAEEAAPDTLDIAFRFVDDNDDPTSSQLLGDFAAARNNALIVPCEQVLEDQGESALTATLDKPSYLANETTHAWTDTLVERVAKMKDHFLACAKVFSTDLFLIDSDVLIDPHTFSRLYQAGKNIVANVFWTQWEPGTKPMPQVWLQDKYSFDVTPPYQGGPDFLVTLAEPGVYEVGGLGACTLIRREAFASNLSFQRLHNVSFWGEDRHFCIRAVAGGQSLWVDTRTPACHVYRASEIYKGVQFLNDCTLQYRAEGEPVKIINSLSYGYSAPLGTPSELERVAAVRDRLAKSFADMSAGMDVIPLSAGMDVIPLTDGIEPVNAYGFGHVQPLANESPISRPRPRVLLSMIVKNEADRYLARMLRAHVPHVDRVLVIDDASTDTTCDLIRARVPMDKLVLVQNSTPLFHEEHRLRRLQWETALGQEDIDWIITLDADEIFEVDFDRELFEMMRRGIPALSFRLFDMWSETEYREDDLWNAHTRYWPMAVNRRWWIDSMLPEGFKGTWPEANQHCGRWPREVYTFVSKPCAARIKHYGWAREEDRVAKVERYKRLDPEGLYGSPSQYASILEAKPNLVTL